MWNGTNTQKLLYAFEPMAWPVLLDDSHNCEAQDDLITTTSISAFMNGYQLSRNVGMSATKPG